MLEAPTINAVLAHPERDDQAACCILLAPPFTKIGKDEVIPRIGYLDCRTSQQVHFYCAGYGGYWHPSIIPDMQEIGTGKYEAGTEIPWAFSQQLFAEFVDQLEEITEWQYSGNAEIIFLGPDVNFANSLVLNVDAMIKDQVIGHSSELFEAIIQYCRSAKDNPNAFDFSDLRGLQTLKNSATDSLLSFLPTAAQGLWKKGRHYAVRNIAKQE